MDISDHMVKLRKGLDKLHIDYQTDDYEHPFGDPGYCIHYEHSYWQRTNGRTTSVIFMKTQYPDHKAFVSSYGLPGQLECWQEMNVGNPIGMDVDDILKLADETGVRK